MDIKLTIGAVSTIMNGGEVEKPVFQILGFKKIGGQGGNDRYRLNISDGQHTHTFAMLATQLNSMILNGELDNHCIIRADKLVSNTVSPEKRVLIILELTVLAKGTAVGKKIGEPVVFTDQTPPAGNSNGGGVNAQVKTERSRTAGAFYGSKPAAPAVRAAGGNMSFGMGDAVVIPIRDLTPYNSKCTIKARVTNKSPVKTWSNARGDGKLFNVDLLDESGEIRMTGFNQAVDNFYDMVKVSEVYLFSKFACKPANKQFTSLTHDYELSFNNDTEVIPCLDSDAQEIPTLTFTFVDIKHIEGIEKDRMIDVIGICKRRLDLGTIITKKDGKELQKRDIILVDRTNVEIPLTLWGKLAEDFVDDSNPVIAVKGARVGDFSGKNLSLLASSSFLINPDISEAHILRGWYDNEGINLESKSLANARGMGGGGANAPWKLIGEVNASDANAFNADAGYYFRSKIMVLAVKRENAMYKACPEEKCKKKVVDGGNGLFRCEKCNKESADYKWQLIVNMCFGDCSDSIWATCFQETGEFILGKKTEELGKIFEEKHSEFDDVVKSAVFKSYTVKFRGKMETYNNENRMRYTVMDVQPIKYDEYARELVNQIKETIS